MRHILSFVTTFWLVLIYKYDIIKDLIDNRNQNRLTMIPFIP